MIASYETLNDILENDLCQDIHSKESNIVEQLCDSYEQYLRQLPLSKLTHFSTINELYFLAKKATYRFSRDMSVSAYRYVYFSLAQLWDVYSNLMHESNMVPTMDVIGQLLTLLDTEALSLKMYMETANTIEKRDDIIYELEHIGDFVTDVDLDHQIRHCIEAMVAVPEYDDTLQYYISGFETVLMALRSIRDYYGYPFFRRGWHCG